MNELVRWLLANAVGAVVAGSLFYVFADTGVWQAVFVGVCAMIGPAWINRPDRAKQPDRRQ